MSTYFTDRAHRRPLGTPVRPAGSGGGGTGPAGPPGPTGATGATGATGPAGPGVAPGGTTGQVLAKTSAVDYATGWTTPATVPPPVAIGATAPASPVVGQLWWRTTDGNLYLYYNDGTSTQWVPAMASVGMLTAPPSGSSGTLVVSDTFESYTAGSDVSAPWIGSSNSQVVTAQAHGGTKSLSVGMTGVASTARLPLGTSLSKWSIDVWLWINASGGTTAQYIGCRIPGSASGILLNIAASGAGRVFSGGTVFFSFTGVTTGVWHHCVLTVVQSASAGSITLTIDGVSMGSFAGNTTDSEGNLSVGEFTAAGQGIGPSPPAEIYVDDLFVYQLP